jgi:mitochondrial cardiolipin hydrolase
MTPEELAGALRRSQTDPRGGLAELARWADQHLVDEPARALARHAAYNAARAAMSDSADANVIGWLEDVMKVLAPAAPDRVADDARSATLEKDRACFSPGEQCLGAIIHRFEECRTTADLCVFTITDDRISRSILDAHRRRVKIRILSDQDKSGDLGSDMRQFREAGIAVKLADVFTLSGPRHEGHMHHKFAIFDGERLINGSYNWTRGAANVNFENLVDTANPDLISVFSEEFRRLWNKF